MRLVRICIAALISAVAFPLLALSSDRDNLLFSACSQGEAKNDPAAIAWLTGHGGSLKFPADDYYRYQSGPLKAADVMTSPNGAFAADSRAVCPGDVRFCVTGATWSADRSLIAFAAGDPSRKLPPEVLVVRTSDGQMWRASPPEEEQDVAWSEHEYRAFDGWPSWTTATSLTYTRCVPTGRFDIILLIGTANTVSLPNWLGGNETPPPVQVDGAVLKAMPDFVMRRGSQGNVENTTHASLAVDSTTSDIYVVNGASAGRIEPSGAVHPLDQVTKSLTRYSLLSIVRPYSLVSVSGSIVLTATSPHNYAEASELDRVDVRSGSSSLFSRWDWNPFALAIDSHDGSAFVADPYANTIYRAVRGQKPQKFAGACPRLTGGDIDAEVPQLCRGGRADGKRDEARFNQPSGVAYDASDRILFVADTANNLIRGVRGDGTVFTLAGRCVLVADNPNCIGMMSDGQGSAARFFYPTGIVYDAQDRCLYVADKFNDAIRRVSLIGVVSTIAGNGSPGDVDGSGRDTRFNFPSEIAYDAHDDSLVVLDEGNDAIRRIARDRRVSTLVKGL